MILVLLLILSISLEGVRSMSCLSCHHDHHHHGTYDAHACTVHQCDYNQFCKLKVHGHDYRVEGECRDLDHHEKGLQHCYHDMKHWCADFRLALYHGECVFCCRDEDCVRNALNIVAPNLLTTTAKATAAATTHVQQTKAVTTMSPQPQTTQSATSCNSKCEDIATDCATTANVCTMKYGNLVCKKYCGLCGAGTTTPLPKCVDHLKEDICHTMPNVCTNSLAPQICPRFCGLCQSGSQTSLTSPSAAATTTIASSKPQTNSVCQDHSAECSDPNVCNLPYGDVICPLTCNNCSGVTSPKPTSTHTSGHIVSTTKQTVTAAHTSGQSQTTAPTTHKPAKQHMCYQCGDYNTNDPCTMAELALGTPTPCTNGAYCMTDVFNTLTGDSEIIKRCVQKLECTRKWFDETSDRKACTNFDSVFLVPRLTCHFCCTGDGCNTDIVPAKTTLFRP